MDSMRHLSTSLPSASRRNDLTSDILTDFRAAALSVTNLYKTAARSQDKARAAGYQDALDDLLAFLDKENLGLMDGEGWRVRQWATERLDGDGSSPRQPADAGNAMVDDDDDEDTNSTAKEEDKDDAGRSTSPEVTRKPHRLPATVATSTPSTSTSTNIITPSNELAEDDATSSQQYRRVVSEPPQLLPPQQTAPQTIFTFGSSLPYPTNHEREGNEGSSGGMDLDTGPHSIPNPSHHHQQHQYLLHPSSTNAVTDAVRIVPRTRNSRHGSHNRRNDSRMPTINFNLGAGAGSKRKMPYQDFFDISGFNNTNATNNDASGERRDGNGNGNGGGRGGKRGRHV